MSSKWYIVLLSQRFVITRRKVGERFVKIRRKQHMPPQKRCEGNCFFCLNNLNTSSGWSGESFYLVSKRFTKRVDLVELRDAQCLARNCLTKWSIVVAYVVCLPYSVCFVSLTRLPIDTFALPKC